MLTHAGEVEGVWSLPAGAADALAYVDTLMVQDVAEDSWAERLTTADWCGLNPLFWTQVDPSAQ